MSSDREICKIESKVGITYAETLITMKLTPLNTVQNTHEESIWTAAWNREGPEKVQTNTGHFLGVVSVAAHPSGRIAASASINSFIQVFDVATNNTIATLETPPSEVWQLQFNP
ncbi:hypothetical protein CASFOL_036618 [Castilleja foliolosa]|uniref:Uncharacterized protein n=1 Tax=Castilleja foliolosa TaxID=1961234 RepID=A0ABD3BQM3_9LAMI